MHVKVVPCHGYNLPEDGFADGHIRCQLVTRRLCDSVLPDLGFLHDDRGGCDRLLCDKLTFAELTTALIWSKSELKSARFAPVQVDFL